MKNHVFPAPDGGETLRYRPNLRRRDVSRAASRRSRHRRYKGEFNHGRSLAKLAKVFVQLLVCAIVAALIGVILLEAAAGCGSTIYHEDGTTTQLGCIFIPHETTYGRWK